MLNEVGRWERYLELVHRITRQIQVDRGSSYKVLIDRDNVVIVSANNLKGC